MTLKCAICGNERIGEFVKSSFCSPSCKSANIYDRANKLYGSENLTIAGSDRLRKYVKSVSEHSKNPSIPILDF